jgi:hypothetical protein
MRGQTLPLLLVFSPNPPNHAAEIVFTIFHQPGATGDLAQTNAQALTNVPLRETGLQALQ